MTLVQNTEAGDMSKWTMRLNLLQMCSVQRENYSRKILEPGLKKQEEEGEVVLASKWRS
jgi:hypothetical protein